MILGTENNGLIALVAISLAAFKDCLPIMKGSVGRANLNILVRHDTRVKPSLAFARNAARRTTRSNMWTTCVSTATTPSGLPGTSASAVESRRTIATSIRCDEPSFDRVVLGGAPATLSRGCRLRDSTGQGGGNPDDETAAQRYDAFGKTALWYVEETGPDARLYLGFKRPVSADEFYRACLDNKVERLLHSVRPAPGEMYLIRPGQVHAAKDVTLLEVAESSELWFRLHDWGSTDRELHLEEAFDLIDLSGKVPAHRGEVVSPQFTANQILLTEALKSHRDEDDTFLLYICLKGAATVQADGENYRFRKGELLLIPAEVNDFFLIPEEKDTLLMEVRMDPREKTDSEE